MTKLDASTWTLTAAALFSVLCAGAAWNSLEVQLPDQTTLQAALSVQDIPKVYRAISRAEIMLRAAGNVLN